MNALFVVFHIYLEFSFKIKTSLEGKCFDILIRIVLILVEGTNMSNLWQPIVYCSQTDEIWCSIG